MDAGLQLPPHHWISAIQSLLMKPFYVYVNVKIDRCGGLTMKENEIVLESSSIYGATDHCFEMSILITFNEIIFTTMSLLIKILWEFIYAWGRSK